MKRFFGWFFVTLGILMLLFCTYAGVILAYIIPIALAAFIIYVGISYLNSA